MNEAEVFEYLTRQVKAHGVSSIGMRVEDGLCGNYVAVWNTAGRCGIGQTITQAVNRLPDMNQSVTQMLEEARVMVNEAAALREKAEKILGTTLKPGSFGPDD